MLASQSSSLPGTRCSVCCRGCEVLKRAKLKFREGSRDPESRFRFGPRLDQAFEERWLHVTVRGDAPVNEAKTSAPEVVSPSARPND